MFHMVNQIDFIKSLLYIYIYIHIHIYIYIYYSENTLCFLIIVIYQAVWDSFYEICFTKNDFYT